MTALRQRCWCSVLANFVRQHSKLGYENQFYVRFTPDNIQSSREIMRVVSVCGNTIPMGRQCIVNICESSLAQGSDWQELTSLSIRPQLVLYSCVIQYFLHHQGFPLPRKSDICHFHYKSEQMKRVTDLGIHKTHIIRDWHKSFTYAIKMKSAIQWSTNILGSKVLDVRFVR
jgi:hypothetical protein